MAFATFVGQAAAGPPIRVLSCVLNGACCGGAAPYYGEINLGTPGRPAITYGCYKDAACTQKIAICSPAACCGGTGSCVTPSDGTWKCYSDASCNTPC